jgi:hypothetical protein
MPAHSGLALAQYPGQLGDRQLVSGKKGQQTQAGGFSGGAQTTQQRFHDPGAIE